MQKEANQWRIIRLRLLIETEEQASEDPLHRAVGEHIWPEYFTPSMVSERMQNPRASGIEQQEPSPEKGGFFQREWFDNNEYNPSELPPLKDLRIYTASDHAVSERQAADPTCIVVAAFYNERLYILPHCAWRRMGSKEAVDEMLKIAKTYKPLYWWAEKGHISKSILPFLQDRMMDEHCYANIVEVTPVKDKMTRAQSISAMMSMGMVKWPRTADWYKRAKHELLLFPNGKHDDFVDAVAHLGCGIHTMTSPAAKKAVPSFNVNRPFALTSHDLKQQDAYRSRLTMLATQGF